ncbi:MAG: PHP domain-containing protein, partial [Anaerolineae bacterium]|nr:PHP domain-containing protein [Anaerolineae bacterium]
MTDYVELHCHSHYSLLDGASSPQALLSQASELGMPALALTDHDNLYGAVEFATLARQQGIQPIHGAELTLHDKSHITLLVKNEQGWRNLCWLITQAQHNAPKGEAVLQDGALIGHTDGLIALSGCRHSRVMSALLRRDRRAALSAIAQQIELFGRENYWLELQHHILPEDDELIYMLAAIAKKLHIGCVATNNVHYAVRDRSRLQDILTCIRHSTHLDDGQKYLRPSSEYYLKSAQEMRTLFKNYPDALVNTLVIADQCQFDLQTIQQELPDYLVPDNVSAAKYLTYL